MRKGVCEGGEEVGEGEGEGERVREGRNQMLFTCRSHCKKLKGN